MKDDYTYEHNAKRRRLLMAAGGLIAIPLHGLLSRDVLASTAVPKQGGTLIYSNTYPNNKRGDARTGRHPYHWLDLNTRTAYNGLVSVDEHMEVQPELATSWQSSDDQKVWDIQLREGVRFHDGRDMTADDVVASYQYHQQKTSYARQIVNVEKTGAHSVRMHLVRGNSEFPYTMGEYQLMIMPAEPLETIGFSGIGTGPFKVVSLDAKRRIITERNEDYWREGFPYLDRLEVVNAPGRMESALNGFRAKMFDVVLGVDPALLPDLQRMDDIEVDYASAGDQAVMVLPKHEGSVFNDVRIRKALALAIDREKIASIVYGEKTGWIGNDTHLGPSNNEFAPAPARNVEEAKALLAQAGYPDGITLPTFYFTASWPEIPRVFQVLAESVKDAGITLPIEQRPSDGYRSWRVEDKEQTRKHRFAYGPAGMRNPAVSLFRMRPDYNESGYWSGAGCDEYMALYEKSTAEKDPAIRQAIYARMQEILHDEVPAILPVGRKNLLIRRPEVRGLVNHAQPWSIRFEEVWKA